MEKVWKQTGVKPPELANQPKLPKELAMVWEWFVELRALGDFTWSDIAAWEQIRGVRLTPMESGLLLDLQGLYCVSQDGHGHHHPRSSSR